MPMPSNLKPMEESERRYPRLSEQEKERLGQVFKETLPYLKLAKNSPQPEPEE